MSGGQVKYPGSATAETAVPPAAHATHPLPHSKILPLAALAALLTAAATLILFMPSGAGNSTLRCYDRAGNYEPCGTQASAPEARADSRTARIHRPPSWIVAALYRPNWEKPTWETPAVEQPVNSTASVPAAHRSSKKHLASACGRHLMPCFFSAVRRGITHLASAAGTIGQVRPAREHL